MTLVGLLSGYPTAALGQPLGDLADGAAGEEEPENAADFARGLVSGR